MAPQTLQPQARIQSLDILRGAVMVLMAIDHVRVYSGLPAGGPDAGIFFTRWITHFCAPAFVFFAGTSAFLYGNKLNNVASFARFLVTRGLLLVILELTVIRFGWTFNLNLSEFALAGVIWMLGWCMVLLALFVRMRPAVVAGIGLAIVFLQQFFGYIPYLLPESSQASFGKFWEFIYSSGMEPWSGMAILYVLVPWVGIMMAGYGFGNILLMERARRNTLCLRIGLTATLLFLIIGSVMILNAPDPEAPPFIFRLLNQRKYPASPLFLMMTLGPAIALIPSLEQMKGRLTNWLTIFGRVPFFYYLLHIPLIHISALVVTQIREGAMHHEWYDYAPFASVPPELKWNLPLLYLVFVVDVFILYVACKWYAAYKAKHPEKKWLRFL